MFVFVFRVPYGSVWDYHPRNSPHEKIPQKILDVMLCFYNFLWVDVFLSSFQVAFIWDLRESLKSQFAADLGLKCHAAISRRALFSLTCDNEMWYM